MSAHSFQRLMLRSFGNHFGDMCSANAGRGFQKIDFPVVPAFDVFGMCRSVFQSKTFDNLLVYCFYGFVVFGIVRNIGCSENSSSLRNFHWRRQIFGSDAEQNFAVQNQTITVIDIAGTELFHQIFESIVPHFVDVNPQTFFVKHFNNSRCRSFRTRFENPGRRNRVGKSIDVVVVEQRTKITDSKCRNFWPSSASPIYP